MIASSSLRDLPTGYRIFLAGALIAGLCLLYGLFAWEVLKYVNRSRFVIRWFAASTAIGERESEDMLSVEGYFRLSNDQRKLIQEQLRERRYERLKQQASQAKEKSPNEKPQS